MKKTKKCAFCGREFTANSGMQKYCCVGCADEAKRERKKRNGDFLKTAEPIIGLREQGAHCTLPIAFVFSPLSNFFKFLSVNKCAYYSVHPNFHICKGIKLEYNFQIFFFFF